MTKKIGEHIERFCFYFEDESQRIDAVDFDKDKFKEPSLHDSQLLLYKKTLLVTALDALAGVRFPEAKYPALHRKNEKRFTRFIRECAKWENGSLVSSLFLLKELKSINSPNDSLSGYLKSKVDHISGYEGGITMFTKVDEPPESLLPLAASEKEEDAIWKYQHYALLYRYRCCLVHESKQPGLGMDLTAYEQPYYHGDMSGHERELTYPLPLFQQLLKTSITNLKQYLVANKVDPYEGLGKDKSRW